MAHANSNSPAAEESATSQVKYLYSAEDFDGDLTHRPLDTLSSSRLNLELRAEILKAVQDAATAQQHALKVNIEGMRTELEKNMRSRQEERGRKLALLLEGRQTRVSEMKKWKEAKKDFSNSEGEGENATAVLKEALVELPRMIHSLDHLRMKEIEQHNQREEEEDCLELEAWRKQHAHLGTMFKQQSQETLARVAQLWKEATEGCNGMCKKTSNIVHILVQEAPQEKTNTLAPVISSESAVTLALPLPSKLPPLTSKLTPLPSTLPPLPSKRANFPAKLPPLNPGLRRAFCNPVAPLPPIQSCKYDQEDLELVSISEQSTQSAVAEHLMVTLDADGQGPDATSIWSSESLAAGDSVVEQEKKKKRSFKKRFIQFFRKLNCFSAKED